MFKFLLPFLSFCLICCPVYAKLTADFNDVIPRPLLIDCGEKNSFFELTKDTPVIYSPDNERNAEFLAGYIESSTGIKPVIFTKKRESEGITLRTDKGIVNLEGYAISVKKNGIVISGGSPAGVFYGIQTLRKSIRPQKTDTILIPYGRIEDSPRFGYRGAMLDVSRHFFNCGEVKQFIDILALHNINRFHWHLSDDQGWRIEIKSRPELTQKASVRPETVIGHNTPEYDGIPHGGFYTQDEIKDIVRYASDRNITIIPEIDLPGHAQASLTAYPYLGCTGGPYELWKIWGVSEDVLCAGNDSTYSFISDVLNEVADMFPGELFHIGGDECPKRNWKECPKCQAKIRSLGLEDKPGSTAEQQLQSHIMEYAGRILAEKGKKVVGWDEILEGGINKNAVIMSWRGESGGIEAAKKGHKAIMTPTTHTYFDYFQTLDVENEPDANSGYVPVEKVYGFNPVPDILSDSEKENIIGLQACLWTAYIPELKTLEYMTLPRLAALSEVQWCAPGTLDYTRFCKSLSSLFNLYDNCGYNYSRRIFDVKADYRSDNKNSLTEIRLSGINGADIYYTLDGTTPDINSAKYTAPLRISHPVTLKAIAFNDGEKSNVFTDFIDINLASFKDIRLETEPNEKWKANGASTLNDALHGNANRESGRWIGYRDNDLIATIDLKDPAEISEVYVATCMVKNEWTFHAKKITVELSDNGEDFVVAASEEYPHITWDMPDGVRNNVVEFKPRKARFIRVAVSPDREPEGYKIHGGGYVFVDEIVVR